MNDHAEDLNLFTNDQFEWLDAEFTLESPKTLPKPLKLTTRTRKREMISAMREEELRGFWTALPGPDEALHMVSNGKFDYWNFVPIALELCGQPALEFYGSTWTMNRGNALELLALYDAGKLQSVSIFTGLMFKRRESAVYHTIAGGLLDRGQRFLCFENHAKLILLRTRDHHLVIEGSANFTANPRVEQNTVYHSRDLYEFHRGWMEEMLSKNGQGGNQQCK